MPAYRSAGGLDDPSLADGDVGFVGMDARRSPEQLGQGEVVLSRNGRMEGYWQGRKGLDSKSGSLVGDIEPLQLPFFLPSGTLGKRTISSATRSGNVVTLVLSGAHGLTGTAWLTIGDIETPGSPPLTGTNNVPAGAYLMSVVDSDELSFAHTGANETFSVNGTTGVVQAQIDNNSAPAIRGSCLFSDPSTSASESIILATNDVAKRLSLETFATPTDIAYPTGSVLSADVDMIQAFDRVYLFRKGEVPWEWIPAGRPLVSAAQSGTTVTIGLTAHGFTAGDSVVISGLTGGSPTENGTFEVATASLDSFTYTAVSSQTVTYGVTSAKATGGFTKVQSGAYTQPQTFAITAKDVDVVSGKVTATVVSNNTIKVGDFVTIYEAVTTALASMVGKSYQVVTATSTTIEWYAPVGNYNTSSSDVFEFGGRFSVGGGFIHMPAPPWAVYFQRRLWCPFWYTPTGAAGAATYSYKNEMDQIVASDILDGNTFDQLFSQFRITGGIADYVVGMHPFYDDALMVLNRNSLHLVAGTQGTLSDTVVKELTREVGCMARKSIVGMANAVFFLSDNGIYGVEFANDYNLRGVQEPLSKPIQPYIDRINKSLADRAVAVYFNNRYYIALPLDKSPGQGDAQGNNSILVFNMLNKGWESVDTFAEGFNIANFHIGLSGARNNLYAIAAKGGAHLMEARDQPVDRLIISSDTIEDHPVASLLRTRGYKLDTMERKKFSRMQVQCQSGDEASDLVFKFESEDPDAVQFDVGTLAGAIGDDLPSNESANVRYRLGNPRGLYGILTIEANIVGSYPVGRPKISSVMVEGTVTNRQTITQY